MYLKFENDQSHFTEFMDGTSRRNIRPGITVDIVLKADQPTGKLTRGVVAQILTSKSEHPRGIKVRLSGGQVGRVQRIVEATSAKSVTPDQVRGKLSPRPLPSGRGRQGEARGRSGGRSDTRSRDRKPIARDREKSAGGNFGRRPERPEPEPGAPLKKSACDCCGFLTLERKNAYEICPVCYWEDDPAQLKNPDSRLGSNHISLNDARQNFSALGTCEARYVKAVRKPLPEEFPA